MLAHVFDGPYNVRYEGFTKPAATKFVVWKKDQEFYCSERSVKGFAQNAGSALGIAERGWTQS